MIMMEDLLNHKGDFGDVDVPTGDNLMELLGKVNKAEERCPIKGWKATSGIRTWEDHTRIYKNLAKNKKRPFEDGIYIESKVPKKSKHLFGQAVDIYDPGLKITAWLKANPEVLEELGLWCEEGNSNWVHFQIVPHGSWKPGEDHWFIP